ncbi:MAG: hypothetical protein K0S27_1374 [Gammaproteobacteria bacterium]|jgi:hypothetical protein|nr:hypothetical protein [Gammaproteobacteria bacterium]
MARDHEVAPPISLAAHQQAREAIEEIKGFLLQKEFAMLGWFPKVIIIHNQEKEVPNTIFDAYHSLIKKEATHPLHALAAYYAHFIVAIKPEHDHVSRQKETREIYQDMAKIKGEDIFSADPEAARLFNTLLQAEVMAITAKRSPEQKEFIDFQEKVKIEIQNIQTLIENFKVFEKAVLPLRLRGYPHITEEIIFLGQVIDRMRTATSKKDITLYAKDALRILDRISIHVDENSKNQITELQDSIRKFRDHHRELMTSLSDKKNALYLSSALQGASIVVASPLPHVIPLPSKEALEVLRHPTGAEKGITPAAEAALNAAADQQEQTKVEEERSIVRHMPGLHNISEVAPATSLSDKYAHAQEAVKDPEVQGKLAKSAICTIVSAAFPPLALPIAVTSAVYSAGSVAFDFFKKHKELEKQEKIAKLERAQHTREMQDFLQHAGPSPPG